MSAHALLAGFFAFAGMVAIVGMVGCHGGSDTNAGASAGADADASGQAATTDASSNEVPSGDATTAPSAAEPVPESEITLLYPGLNDDLLHIEKRSVVALGSPQDQAKLVLSELIKGPSPGLLRAIPDGVEVREVFLLEDGTAWADLSAGILGHADGTTRELLMLYSIVDTLALNISQIKRVGILVEGQPHQTLDGHIDVSKPIAPDKAYIAGTANVPKGGGDADASAGAGAGGDGAGANVDPGGSGDGTSGRDQDGTAGATGAPR